MNAVDVVILGAGPAGAALAICLARAGRKVVLLERSVESTIRIGEMLPPRAVPCLRELDLWEPFQSQCHRESRGVVSIWGSDKPYENDFVFNPYGTGWHLDRRRFDEMLVSAAVQQGARIVRPVRASSCSHKSGLWTLQADMHDGRKTFLAPLLVDATGRACWVGRRQYANKNVLDRLVAVVQYFTGADAGHDSRTFIESHPGGWWYTAPLSDDEIVAVSFTDDDLLPSFRGAWYAWWQEQLRSSPLTRDRLSGWKETTSPRLVSAQSYRLCPMAGSSWLAIGDAAMALDPLSASGIYRALHWAPRVAQEISAWFDGDRNALMRVQSRWQDDYQAYLADRAWYYARERRWSSETFWRRRKAGQLPRAIHHLAS